MSAGPLVNQEIQIGSNGAQNTPRMRVRQVEIFKEYFSIGFVQHSILNNRANDISLNGVTPFFYIDFYNPLKMSGTTISFDSLGTSFTEIDVEWVDTDSLLMCETNLHSAD